MVVPSAVSASSQVVGRRSYVLAVTSAKSAAVKPAAASNVAIAKRFVSLNGSGIDWESATEIGFGIQARSAAVIPVQSRGVTSVPSNGIAVKVP